MMTFMYKQTGSSIVLLGLLMLVISSCKTAPVQMPEAILASYTTARVQKSATPTPRSIATPIHIRIPAIGVDAAIEPVGVLNSGNLDTPHQQPWDDAGWYSSGYRPGEQGSAVIDAHVDRPGGGPATFWYLHLLQPGDQIMITTASQQQLSFRVTRTTNYPVENVPLQTIFADSSGKYLNLITCAGYYVPSLHGTTLRTVVFTVLQ